MIKAKRLPNIWDRNNIPIIEKMENFYICLIQITEKRNKVRRNIKPVKVLKIEKSDKAGYVGYKLITEKGRNLNYNTTIYCFDKFSDCANFYDSELKRLSNEISTRMRELEKIDEVLSKSRINVRGKILNNILNEK